MPRSAVFRDAGGSVCSDREHLAEASDRLKQKKPPDLDLEDRLKDLDRERSALRKIRDEVQKVDNLAFLTGELERPVNLLWSLDEVIIALQKIRERLRRMAQQEGGPPRNPRKPRP